MEELDVLCVMADSPVSGAGSSAILILCCGRCLVLKTELFCERSDHPALEAELSVTRDSSLCVYSSFKLYLGFSRFSIGSNITGIKPFYLYL
jgi:hypothetical protein